MEILVGHLLPRETSTQAMLTSQEASQNLTKYGCQAYCKSLICCLMYKQIERHKFI